MSYSPWGHKKVGHDLATEEQQLNLKYCHNQNCPEKLFLLELTGKKYRLVSLREHLTDF